MFTDHQIFDRYHKFRIKGIFSGKESLSLKELTSLNPGDYVVHVDHGIGKFGGLEKVEINGKIQENIKLVYRDNDTLYVGIHALHRISKYKGRDSGEPRIYKLGTGAWQKLKVTDKEQDKRYCTRPHPPLRKEKGSGWLQVFPRLLPAERARSIFHL
ncbi:MAG: CarD family transcriptional regulator [Bacteroidales bacterium]|nr:CarD family transcriptional regulator [Bacteroidales bacterium]